MPTYDYVCDACGHAFEHFQSITSKPERTCPSCGKRKLRRLIGTGAAILVGGRGGASEPAEASSDEGESKKAPDSTSDSNSDSTSKTDAAPKERQISGSTSTPTHEAREGRGVGNLVDAARRQRKESETSTTPKKSDPAPKPSKKTTESKAKAKTKKTPRISKTSKKSSPRARS